MMVRCLLAGLLFFLVQVIPAQTWGEFQARWTFDYFDFSRQGKVQWTVKGDTIIQEKPCKIFEKNYKIHHLPTGAVTMGSYLPDIMYEYDGVIYWYNASLETFDTLFWFDAVPGQTWSIQAPAEHGFEVLFLVVDTATIDINGMARKTLNIQYESGVAGGDDILIEGIGPTIGYMLPWDLISGAVDGEHEGNSFVCFYDDQLGDYPAENQIECDLLLATDLHGEDRAFSIYPNPAAHQLFIDYPTFIDQIIFIDARGNKIEMKPHKNIIGLAELPAGLYWMRIPGENTILPFVKLE